MRPIDSIIVEVNVNANSETESGIVYRMKGVREADEAVEFGIVKHVPKDCKIPVGSKLYFHRSVTMTNHLEDKLFTVPYNESTNHTFGYVDGDDFVVTGDYSLIEADKIEEVSKGGIIIPVTKGYEGYEENYGTMKYPRENVDIEPGVICHITPKRCYFLKMEGIQYWAVQDNYLLAYEVAL